MTQSEILNQTKVFVQNSLKEAEGGHDWFHIERVWKSAKNIAKDTPCNMLIVELGALLHDIADSKFHNGDESIGPKKAQDFLGHLNLDKGTIEHVLNIIKNISFGGGNHAQKFQSIELDIIQDADRLDALGAIGIARAFNYGGFKNRGMYDPEIAPNLNMTKEEYKKSQAPTINHFYEKLLLLKDKMNTEKGKSLALKRHVFLELYLEQFYAEWEGKI
mgnify:CR=1 FL=1